MSDMTSRDKHWYWSRGVLTSLAVVGGALLLTTGVIFPSTPLSAQPPTVIMLGDVGGTPQTARAATSANMPLASTLTGRHALGVQLETEPSQWIVSSQPASGSVASASIAAEVGVRHVARCVGWSAVAAGAVTAAAGTILLRDGATGAGTVLVPYAIAHSVAAAAGVQTVPAFAVCGLSFVGTTNTAMTVEFDAGVAGETQRVWISGINIQ